MQPQYDNSARTTATSRAEGRLKVDAGGTSKKKKRKMIKNKKTNNDVINTFLGFGNLLIIVYDLSFIRHSAHSV